MPYMSRMVLMSAASACGEKIAPGLSFSRCVISSAANTRAPESDVLPTWNCWPSTMWKATSTFEPVRERPGRFTSTWMKPLLW